MSFSTILSAVIEGLEVAFIHVEADISNGLPVFHMVGYLSSEVKEAGERVRTAIKNSGFEYPAKRTVVNLSPATMRKHGASFDLPIAVAILTALGQIEQPEKNCLIIGELSLGGSVKKVSGVLPIIMEAKEKGVKKCIVPLENVSEASLVSEMEIIGAATLQEAVEGRNEKESRFRKNRSRNGKISRFCRYERSGICKKSRGNRSCRRAQSSSYRSAGQWKVNDGKMYCRDIAAA